MRTNEHTVTGKSVVFFGLGTIIGIIGISMVKALVLGMTFADGMVSFLPDMVGRAACVILVYSLYYSLRKH